MPRTKVRAVLTPMMVESTSQSDEAGKEEGIEDGAEPDTRPQEDTTTSHSLIDSSISA